MPEYVLEKIRGIPEKYAADFQIVLMISYAG